jgi:predicted RNase H-like nuclease (RuvC/YqgF family)
MRSLSPRSTGRPNSYILSVYTLTVVHNTIPETNGAGGRVVVQDVEDLRQLKARVRELEEKLAQVRLSRRVLLHLLEQMEAERSQFVKKLETENRRLQKANARYARSLLKKNQQIIELESKLQGGASQNS